MYIALSSKGEMKIKQRDVHASLDYLVCRRLSVVVNKETRRASEQRRAFIYVWTCAGEVMFSCQLDLN